MKDKLVSCQWFEKQMLECRVFEAASDEIADLPQGRKDKLQGTKCLADTQAGFGRLSIKGMSVEMEIVIKYTSLNV